MIPIEGLAIFYILYFVTFLKLIIRSKPNVSLLVFVSSNFLHMILSAACQSLAAGTGEAAQCTIGSQYIFSFSAISVAVSPFHENIVLLAVNGVAISACIFLVDWNVSSRRIIPTEGLVIFYVLYFVTFLNLIMGSKPNVPLLFLVSSNLLRIILSSVCESIAASKYEAAHCIIQSEQVFSFGAISWVMLSVAFCIVHKHGLLHGNTRSEPSSGSRSTFATTVFSRRFAFAVAILIAVLASVARLCWSDLPVWRLASTPKFHRSLPPSPP